LVQCSHGVYAYLYVFNASRSRLDRLLVPIIPACHCCRHGPCVVLFVCSDVCLFFCRNTGFFLIVVGRGGWEGAGGRVRNFFFGIFFFFASFGGGEGGGGERVTPKPEAQVARFLVGMFRNRFFEAGVDAKVSPRVAKGRQSVTEAGGGGTKKCHLHCLNC
jgi:hypothetical protein